MSAPAVPVDLQTLAAEIKVEIAAAERDARSAVEHARRAGALLIEAKARVPHGTWLAWLEANCPVAERTAQAYMRLARHLAELPESEAQRVADLPLRGALAALADPVDPYEDLHRAVERLKDQDVLGDEYEAREQDRLRYVAAVDEAARRLEVLRARVEERLRRDGVDESLPDEDEELRQIGRIWDSEILPTIRRWGEDTDFVSLHAEKFPRQRLDDLKPWREIIFPYEIEGSA